MNNADATRLFQGFERGEIPEEHRRYLSGFMPLVRFVIARKHARGDYHKFIGELLVSFVEWCDPRNAESAKVMRIRGNYWNQEYGIGQIYVDGQYVLHCKMYLYDGDKESVSPLSDWKPWGGIMFRDHGEQDCRFRNTVKVFRISDAFEKFLKERAVVFARINLAAK